MKLSSDFYKVNISTNYQEIYTLIRGGLSYYRLHPTAPQACAILVYSKNVQ